MKSKAAKPQWVTVEGELDLVAYRLPKGTALLEIQRNLSNELKAAGYTIVMDGPPGRLSANKSNVWYWASVEDAYYTQRFLKQKEMRQQVVASAKNRRVELVKQ